MKKKLTVINLFTILFVLAFESISYAGTWKFDGHNWSNIEATGQVNKGWYSEGEDNWYFLNERGIMLTGWFGEYHLHEINDETFGRMDYGWFHDGINWYFLNTSHDGVFGAKVKGWQWIDGYCYYFASDGRMLSNQTTPDGYFVDNSGHWVTNGTAQFVQGKGLQSIHKHLNETSANNYSSETEQNNNAKSGVAEQQILEKYVNSSEIIKIIDKASIANTETEKEEVRNLMEKCLQNEIENHIVSNYIWDRAKKRILIRYANEALEMVVLWEDYEGSEPILGKITENTGNNNYHSNHIQNQNYELNVKNASSIILSSFDESDEECYWLGAKKANDGINQYNGFQSTLKWKAGVDDYKHIDNYGMIFINAHGFLSDPNWTKIGTAAPFIKTGEKVTLVNTIQHLSDLKAERIIKVTQSKGKAVYAIGPEFFKYYYDTNNANKLDDTFIFVGACYGYYNELLANAFIESGAEAYVSFSNSVYCNYCSATWLTILKSFFEGKSLQEAINTTKDEFGINDQIMFGNSEEDKEPAYIQYTGDQDFRLYEIEDNYAPFLKTQEEEDGSVTIIIGS